MQLLRLLSRPLVYPQCVGGSNVNVRRLPGAVCMLNITVKDFKAKIGLKIKARVV